MANIFMNCKCGYKIDKKVIGYSEIKCPKCGNIYVRYYNPKIEGYEFIMKQKEIKDER